MWSPRHFLVTLFLGLLAGTLLFGCRAFAGHLGHVDLDALAGPQPVGDFGPLAIDGHPVGTDRAPQMDAGIAGQACRQKGIQPLSGVVRVDLQHQRLGSGLGR